MSRIVTGAETARYDDAATVRVQLVRGSLEVLPRDEPGVWIEVSEVVGEPLEIATDADRVSIGYPSIGWDGWIKRLASTDSSDLAHLKIYVGSGVDVSAATVRAEVSATGTTGDVDVSTAAAAIRATRTTGGLKLRSASGAVDVQSHTGPVNVTTAAGSVTVEGELPRVTVTTVAGDISLRHRGGAAVLTTTTVSGATRVRLPAATRLELEARGVAAKVLVDGQQHSSGFGATRLNDGTGERVLVSATTVSGDVVIERRDAAAVTGGVEDEPVTEP